MIKKIKSSFFALLSILLFLSNAVFSQDVPRWEDFKPSLILNHVNDVVFNSQGEVWLLSNSDFISLAKDKTKFTLLDSEHNFEFLEIDQNDTVWLAHAGRRQIDTGNGNDYLIIAGYYNGTLKEYRKSSNPDFPSDPSSNNDDITSLYIDPSGNKWFGFNNGDVGKLDLQYQYTHYPNSFVSSNHVRNMVLDPANGSLYVTISNLLYKLSNGDWDLVTKNWPNNTYLNAVAVTNDGSVLFGGHNGLHTLKDGTFTTQDISNSNIPVDNIDDIKIYGAEIFISGHDDEGYDYVFDGSFKILHRGIAHTPYPSIYSTLFINNTDPLDIWLGTDDDGLVQIGETQSLYYNNQTISLPLGSNYFASRSVFVGELGYVATFAGLTTKRNSLFAGLHPQYTYPSIDLLSDGRTNDIAFDEKQHLYIATDSGLSVLNVTTEAIQNFNKQSYPGLSSEWFFKTFSLGRGFAIAVTQELAILFEDGNISQTYILNAGGLPWGSQWNSVVPKYSGESLAGLWIASDTGLLYYDFTTVTNHNSDIFYSEVTALAEGPNGKLWLGFGYYGYVIQSYDKIDSWTTYDLPEIWPSYSEKQNIVDLEFDLKDTLWVLADYAVEGTWRGNSKLLAFTNETFSVIDRPIDIKEWSNDLTISPKGEKWISSRDGLYVYVDDSYSGIDPCLPVVCPSGTECVDGVCVALADPCEGITCLESETCVDGACFTTDLCAGVTCLESETCVDGACFTTDLCAGVTCLESETCVDGACFTTDLCAGVTCLESETCVDGACFTTDLCAGVTCLEDETCVNGVCFNEITGLADDFAINQTFSLYPNPTQGKIMLSSSENIGKVEIRISDVNGQVIVQKTMNIRKAEKISITDLTSEPAGLKIIVIYQDGQLIYKSSMLYDPK